MARQEDTILLTGLVGGLSYYKTKRGRYFVRRKSGVSRERIMSEPAFARVRENIACFSEGHSGNSVFPPQAMMFSERGCNVDWVGRWIRVEDLGMP